MGSIFRYLVDIVRLTSTATMRFHLSPNEEACAMFFCA